MTDSLWRTDQSSLVYAVDDSDQVVQSRDVFHRGHHRVDARKLTLVYIGWRNASAGKAGDASTVRMI